MQKIHVVPHPAGWAVKRGEAERVSSVHTAHDAAEREAKELAEREGLEVVFHDPEHSARDGD